MMSTIAFFIAIVFAFIQMVRHVQLRTVCPLLLKVVAKGVIAGVTTFVILFFWFVYEDLKWSDFNWSWYFQKVLKRGVRSYIFGRFVEYHLKRYYLHLFLHFLIYFLRKSLMRLLKSTVLLVTMGLQWAVRTLEGLTMTPPPNQDNDDNEEVMFFPFPPTVSEADIDDILDDFLLAAPAA